VNQQFLTTNPLRQPFVKSWLQPATLIMGLIVTSACLKFM
jgi:hypothetical protein